MITSIEKTVMPKAPASTSTMIHIGNDPIFVPIIVVKKHASAFNTDKLHNDNNNYYTILSIILLIYNVLYLYHTKTA